MNASGDPVGLWRGGLSPREGLLLSATLLVALAARGVAVWVWSDHLSDDRDAYLALAQGLAEGGRYSVPGSEVPTAYRPPLYPLLLAPISSPGAAGWRAALHVLLGVLTVGLTYVLGRRLGLRCGAVAAALLVAVDPLLLRYAAFPMTETLATFLVAALLVAATPGPRGTLAGSGPSRQALAGVLFGLCVLCRPSVWAFAGLAAVWNVLAMMWQRRVGTRRGRDAAMSRSRSIAERSRSGGERERSIAEPERSGAEPERSGGAREGSRITVRVPWWSIPAAMIVVAPWVIRNSLALGAPILMTTHGGYTLLLGNNPAFYEEVVARPWGTVWNDSRGGGQQAWVERVNRELEAAGIEGETARDRWMTRRALENIAAQPVMFLKACVLRLTRFWGVVPIGPEGGSLPPAVRWLVGGWYALVFAGAIAGLWVAGRDRRGCWAVCLLMLAAFVLVHLVYWTNARMRAPVMPVIAVLCAAGWGSLPRWGLRRSRGPQG